MSRVFVLIKKDILRLQKPLNKSYVSRNTFDCIFRHIFIASPKFIQSVSIILFSVSNGECPQEHFERSPIKLINVSMIFISTVQDKTQIFSFS